MNIRVYFDEGVGTISFEQVIRGLRSVLANFPFIIQPINHREFIVEEWEINTALLIFPGGRDVPYHLRLQGEANKRIRNFVENGGAYLGLCAGAYYGCSHIEFEKGNSLEICGPRELSFFPGKAVGPAYGLGLFCYNTEQGSRAALIEKLGHWTDISPVYLYYNGGCYFSTPEEFANVTVLGRYGDLADSPPAIIRCLVGKGQAILCGVHPEYHFDLLNPLDPFSSSILPDLEKAEESRGLFWKALISMSLSCTVRS